MEEEKARLDPADRRVDELSEKIEDLARRMARKSQAERELADKI